MAQGVLTPLQLTSGAGLLQNTGIAINSVFSGAVQQYEAIAPIANLLATLSLANDANLANATILSLQTLGNSVCPALGDSIPAASANTAPFPVGNSLGFLGFLETVGNTQLGSGDVGKFAQAFSAAQGYVGQVNLFIISAANANEYLGPTFTNLDDMITGDLTKVSLALPALGADLLNLGFLISLPNIVNLGEPASVLQQLAAVGNMGNSTLPCVDVALRSVGLDTQDIIDLISNNRASLFNPNGLSTNQFDRLQQKAYRAFTLVGGDCLEEVKAVLGVNLPLADMADLLNPTQILPTSYPTLKFGDQLIYAPDSSVNSSISQELNATTASGCDELGKIIPPDQAVANKALQYQLQQVSGIQNLTLPQLAAILV
jgi:hypothetical protein